MKKLTLLAAAIGLLITGHAAAGDPAELCGTYTSVDIDEKTIDMGNNIQFMSFNSSTQMHASEGSKFNELSGQCTGGAMLFPDKTIEAEGLCAVADVSGDVLVYTFTQSRGAKEGKYTRKGGTGKFVSTKDSGWYKPISMNGEITTGNWGGKSGCK
jgi:hypothetical protein